MHIHNLPSLRISVTDKCNNKCWYCQAGGDSASFYVSNKAKNWTDAVMRSIDDFFSLGIRHFSLTGGEPLCDVGKMVLFAKHIKEKLIIAPSNMGYLRINTNGMFVNKNIRLFESLDFDLIKISLNSLRPKTFQYLTNSKNPKTDIREIQKGIKALSLIEQPVRLQSVLLNSNHDELEDFIALALKYQNIQELKLLDLSYYQKTHGIGSKKLWLKEYLDLSGVREYLYKNGRYVGQRYSVGGYGNPMDIFELEGKHIVIRDSNNTAIFHPECIKCSARHICQDGHSNIELGPNMIVKACRSREGKIFYLGQEKEVIEYFQEAKNV